MNFEPFLNHLHTLKQCSPQTIKAYRNDLKLFGAFLQDRSVSRISRVDHALVSEYIEYMRQQPNPRFGRTGLADASIARRLAAVSSYLEFVRVSDPKLRNPLKDLSRRWQKNNEPKPVEDYTLDLLLASIPNVRDRVLFSLLLATGLRVSEVHQLNRDSICIDQETDPKGKVHVIGSGQVVGKGGKRRKFYVDETTVFAFAEYVEARRDDNPALFLSERKQRMSVRAIQYTLDAWCRKLGFSHINVHRLRHTFATRLIVLIFGACRSLESGGTNSAPRW
ncbi:tyrosine-type recombinase/integrase [Tunturibacter empetritectus]|uniref:Site-specific recombinase XerD n=1 Tax=Tunturiibacter lichenicola TaxID=2051959 RepID=A0A7W8J7B9_9BACT|nr:tyrosine-type recombinase/integrase [Edaphobacter lichenicola]MBB5343811.1 site-specific recombinase XerD [Edaphobacter lichenicola]